jgi:hypothetical protein
VKASAHFYISYRHAKKQTKDQTQMEQTGNSMSSKSTEEEVFVTCVKKWIIRHARQETLEAYQVTNVPTMARVAKWLVVSVKEGSDVSAESLFDH